jgi:hypothetical protein
MVNDRLVAAILEANASIPDVTFLALLGRPVRAITICMCADHLIPLTLYEGDEVDEAMAALESAVSSLRQAGTIP